MSSKAYELVQLANNLTVDASGTITNLNIDTTNIDNLVNVDLAIAPEILEIQVSAPAAGQDIAWLWTWETSSLPYARRTITNSPELSVPLYKQGTYTINNYAAYETFGDMTQTHTLYFKWIDSAGTDNLVSWAVNAGNNPVTDSHPDINGGANTQVQRINVNVPATITLPTLTPPSVSYNVTNNGAGAYTFSGSAAGDNPNIGPFYRGGTYTFNVSATGHPFYFTTDNGTNFSSGTYFGEYTTGVTGSRTDSGTVTITVPSDAPDTLYYQCGNHGVMRGAITVKDLAVETNINGNYVIYAMHTQEGHKTPIELRPIPSLVNQMCLVFDASSGKFVPQDLATYVENTPSFENKIREVAGTAELVVEDGSAVIAKVNVYDDSTYLPLTGNNPGDQAFATDTDILYIWDGSAWQQAGAANTDDLSEGTTNLFYTDARVGSYLSAQGYDTATNIVASITDSAPTTLDTLNELAAALGDDPNFATTVTNSIATKLAIADFTTTLNSNSIDALSDVDITSSAPSNGEALVWDGSNFVPGITFSQSDFDTAFATKIASPVAFGSSVTATSFSGDGSALTNITFPATTNRYSYVATSGQTSFTATYTTGHVDVYKNGVKLLRTTDYDDTSGTAIVLTTGANVSDEIEITAFEQFTVSDAVSASAGGTFAGPVAFSGGINGNVGISVSNPVDLLHADGNIRLKTDVSTTRRLYALSGGGSYALNSSGGAAIAFHRDASNNDEIAFETHWQGNQHAERMRIDNQGNVGVGTSSPSSKLNVVKADGVIEAEIGTTNGGHKFISQSDVGYDGFQIYQQHGMNSNRNAFSVQDNRSGSKSPAFAVRGDGRVSIGEMTPHANSALTIGGAHNTSYSSTIYMDNNNTGGSDGFILTTDDTWTIKTNAGQGGLAIGTGVPGSGTVKIYVGDDGTITMGKNVNSYVASSGDSGTELHVTGPISFGQGNNQEWSKAGRRVLGWYSTTYHSSGSYTHIETDLWGGGSPSGNNDYIMGGFEIRGYRYASPGHSFEMIGFHNWSGGLSAYNVASMGNWTAGCIAYVGSNGYVHIRLPNSSYYGFIIDLYQHAWYPIRDINVTNTHYNSTANM